MNNFKVDTTREKFEWRLEDISSEKEKSLIGILGVLKGGPGSGNFGHSGRPGQVGGSGEGGEGGTVERDVKVEAYHGTVSRFENFAAPSADSYKRELVDRLLGPHFAEDPELANRFAGGLYRSEFGIQGASGQHTGQEGGRVIPAKLEFDKVKEVIQPENRVGIIQTDQYAIANEVARVVFPERRDLFVGLMKHMRNVDEDTANRIFDTLKEGKEVTEEIGGATNSASMEYTKEDNVPYDFGSYLGNFGLTATIPGIDKEDYVGTYKEIMASRGIQGLKYQNTSPMETRGVESKTCYIVLDQKAMKPYFEKAWRVYR